MNQRKVLGAPLAHQSLVGNVMLEYKDNMRDWPLERQGTIYRGMTFAQTRDEVVLGGVASNKGMCQLLLSKQSDEERHEIMSFVDVSARKYVTATVSYVGKADYKEAENYIRDFRLCTSDLGREPARRDLGRRRTLHDRVHPTLLESHLRERLFVRARRQRYRLRP